MQRLAKWILPLAGLVLCWLFFRNLDLSKTSDYISKGIWWPLLPIGIVSLLTYVFRALRWNLLIKASGEPSPGGYAAFSALSLGYLSSFFIPRFGEVLRCALLKNRKQLAFPMLLGTVIIERLADMVMLAFILMICFMSAGGIFGEFMHQYIYTPVKTILLAREEAVIMGIGGLLVVGIFMWTLRGKIRHILERKTGSISEKFAVGLTGFRKMKSPHTFLWYTLGIWTCYYLMTWLWFLMFEDTREISQQQVFFIFVIGTIGRSVPIQGGGAGAYHFLVSSAFVLAGATAETGIAMSVLIHGGQTIFTLLAALFSLPFLLRFGRGNTD